MFIDPGFARACRWPKPSGRAAQSTSSGARSCAWCAGRPVCHFLRQGCFSATRASTFISPWFLPPPAASLNRNPLHLIERDFIASVIVEARRNTAGAPQFERPELHHRQRATAAHHAPRHVGGVQRALVQLRRNLASTSSTQSRVCGIVAWALVGAVARSHRSSSPEAPRPLYFPAPEGILALHDEPLLTKVCIINIIPVGLSSGYVPSPCGSRVWFCPPSPHASS